MLIVAVRVPLRNTSTDVMHVHSVAAAVSASTCSSRFACSLQVAKSVRNSPMPCPTGRHATVDLQMLQRVRPLHDHARETFGVADVAVDLQMRDTTISLYCL